MCWTSEQILSKYLLSLPACEILRDLRELVLCFFLKVSSTSRYQIVVLWWIRIVILRIFSSNTKKKVRAPVISLRPLLSSNTGWTLAFVLPWAPEGPWGQLAPIKQRPLISDGIHRRVTFSAALPYFRPSHLTTVVLQKPQVSGFPSSMPASQPLSHDISNSTTYTKAIKAFIGPNLSFF